MAVLARLYNFLDATPAVADQVDAELDQLVAGHNDHETRLAAVLPSGTILATAGPTADTGFLLCDGAAVSRTTYAALFARIGSGYGAGDGSSTFNLPDLRGRVPVGKGTHVDVDALADSDGLAVGSRRPKHSHTVNSHNHGSAGAHTHGILTASTGTFSSVSTGGGGIIEVPSGAHIHGGSTDSQGAHTHNSETPGTDAQGASYQVVNYQIKI